MYLAGLVITQAITGLEADEAKWQAIARRGVTIEYIAANRLIA